MLYFEFIIPYVVLCLFKMCSNVCTCLVWCSFLLSKCIECMLALFRQRAVRGFWVCCWRPPWATTWWRQVSFDLLYPTYFMIHCPTLLYETYGLTSLYLLILIYLFGLSWLAFCYCLNSNQWTWCEIYDTILLSWLCWWSRDTLGGSGLFPEYLFVTTCSWSDHPG
jgi:hypothetical protein